MNELDTLQPPLTALDTYAVIGHPVRHSRSPFIHERFARQCEQTLRYIRIDATPEAFEGVAGRFFAQGGKGLNVTLPHKQAAAALATSLSSRAARAGAVNTLLLRDDGLLHGDNTDGVGLVRDLTGSFGVTVGSRRVLLLGAGGAARGVLDPLQSWSLPTALQHAPSSWQIALPTWARCAAAVSTNYKARPSTSSSMPRPAASAAKRCLCHRAAFKRTASATTWAMHPKTHRLCAGPWNVASRAQ